MRELHARLRVEGLSDAEAALLPMQTDAVTLNAIEISTWRTDAGDLDVLVDIPGRNGERRLYEDLAADSRALDYEGIAVRVAGLSDIIASKEWVDRPKVRRYRSSTSCATVPLDQPPIRVRLASPGRQTPLDVRCRPRAPRRQAGRTPCRRSRPLGRRRRA